MYSIHFNIISLSLSRLDSKENCQKAITALNGTKLSGKGVEMGVFTTLNVHILFWVSAQYVLVIECTA